MTIKPFDELDITDPIMFGLVYSTIRSFDIGEHTRRMSRQTACGLT
ncbi:hypothetical protein IKQ19_09605 [Candidatus Saccharibacteria bacterium]|nr:hypothetical protein [Candidatus Saccharibacteria bacterium]